MAASHLRVTSPLNICVPIMSLQHHPDLHLTSYRYENGFILATSPVFIGLCPHLTDTYLMDCA